MQNIKFSFYFGVKYDRETHCKQFPKVPSRGIKWETPGQAPADRTDTAALVSAQAALRFMNLLMNHSCLQALPCVLFYWKDWLIWPITAHKTAVTIIGQLDESLNVFGTVGVNKTWTEMMVQTSVWVVDYSWRKNTLARMKCQTKRKMHTVCLNRTLE